MQRLCEQNIGLENDLAAISKRNDILLKELNNLKNKNKIFCDETKCITDLIKIIKDFRRKTQMSYSIMIVLFNLFQLKEFDEFLHIFRIVGIAKKKFKEYFTLSQLIYPMSKKKASEKLKENCWEALKYLEESEEGKIVKHNVITKFYWK